VFWVRHISRESSRSLSPNILYIRWFLVLSNDFDRADCVKQLHKAINILGFLFATPHTFEVKASCTAQA